MKEEKPNPKKHFLTRRKFIYGAMGLAVTDAFFIEPNISHISHNNLKVPYLPAALDQLKIVQLTDLHYKPDKDEDLLSTVVEKVNKINPDLIILTGDYVNHDISGIDPMLEYLAKLNPKHGILACMGNHDGWIADGPYFKRNFEKNGIQFLINKNTALTINGEKLHIAATDYIWKGNPDPVATLKGIPKDAPLITMVHEPDYFDTMLQHRDHHLQLSGHTHGGQCRVPFIGYAPKKVKYGKKYIYGEYTKENSSVFVSKGLGTTGIRVRFSCLPEIALHTIQA
ncbi:MAG: metallophosphoesterase [Akkermansiaceae bacterium]